MNGGETDEGNQGQGKGQDDDLRKYVWSVHHRLRTGQSLDMTTMKTYADNMARLGREFWPHKGDDNKDNLQVPVHCQNPKRRKITRTKMDRVSWVVDNVIKTAVDESVDRTVRVLDVGSCWNPIDELIRTSESPLFQNRVSVVALDLMPATGSEHCVFMCDFLKVPLTPPGSSYKLDFEIVDTQGVKYRQLRSLHSCSYDVVVFSFVLEYCPFPKDRALLLVRAWECLQPGGSLVVLRPDSNPSTPTRVQKLKEFRLEVNKIGFHSIRSEKTKYFWAFVWRKSVTQSHPPQLTETDILSSLRESCFAIPQDFNWKSNK